MTDSYTPDMNAGAYEYGVRAAIYDLHMYYIADRDCRKALDNPKSLKELKASLAQLESLVRKIEFKTLAISGVSREVRQDEKQKEIVA